MYQQSTKNNSPTDTCLEVPIKAYVSGAKKAVYKPLIG